MVWVREFRHSHESEAAGTSRLVVLHHNAIDDLAVAAEVSLQAVLSRLPAQAADEELPKITVTKRVRAS